MKKICVLTGTRADYGLLRPVIKAIYNHRNLNLSLLVAGMHLSKEFGYSIKDIIKDGYKIDGKIYMNPSDDSDVAMATAVGKGMIQVTKHLQKIYPDIMLVLGDRSEMLVAAVSAAYMNIPVAHIHGGDTSAGIDESARHAITKFAHIHFPVSKKSAQRIKRMGENEWRINIVGAPGLDTILHKELIPINVLKKKYLFDFKQQYILMIQHPVTTESTKSKKQIIETLSVIQKLKMPTVIIYPNSDAGGRAIITEIKKIESKSYIKTFKTLPQIDYLTILKNSAVLIGNSSSGIIESASYHIPVINIGIRQRGREKSKNVIDVDHNRKEIYNAIRKALYDKKFLKIVKRCKNPYGNGTAGIKIAKILSSIKITHKLLQKRITF